MSKTTVVIVGAGINGLVAANYLQRAGCSVTIIERAERVGGACVSETAVFDGVSEDYALGASVLGLMQDFVFQETGLSRRLQIYAPEHSKLVHFPADREPTWIHRNPIELDREMADKWGEHGDIAAFRADEAKVVRYLQEGYVRASPPSLGEAISVLGDTLVELWITGSARDLLDHYLTSEKGKIYMAMTVTESGPVSLDEPYSAFTIPLMDSGSVFDGYYGFVKGGIWQITTSLGELNTALGVTTYLSGSVKSVDADACTILFEQNGREQRIDFDRLVFGTDPLTAVRLVGDESQIAATEQQRFRGSSGKLNLMFRNPVRWKHGSDATDSDAAFRFVFSVDCLSDFEAATLAVTNDDCAYVPGFMQIYCEGAAMRHMQHHEPFDRLAVFFKNLSLSEPGDTLPEVEAQVRELLFEYVENPEDCVWTRLLTPRDLQQLFRFPGGNLDHTMLVGGQTFSERNYAGDPATRFYSLGEYENIYMCGSGTYPCGSVTGTPGYMCAQQLLRSVPQA